MRAQDSKAVRTRGQVGHNLMMMFLDKTKLCADLPGDVGVRQKARRGEEKGARGGAHAVPCGRRVCRRRHRGQACVYCLQSALSSAHLLPLSASSFSRTPKSHRRLARGGRRRSPKPGRPAHHPTLTANKQQLSPSEKTYVNAHHTAAPSTHTALRQRVTQTLNPKKINQPQTLTPRPKPLNPRRGRS
jgi:hypothetical protein